MRTCFLSALVLFTCTSFVISSEATPENETKVCVVSELPVDSQQLVLNFNRAPLAPLALARLPVGSITPQGWLRHQLELQAQGMHGRLTECSDFLKWEGNGWVEPSGRSGWEELPYWLKGYGDLGYVLHDEKIIKEARRWIEAILATQQPDGWFGPAGLRKSLKGQADMWPHMPVLNALQSYYEFSGDARVLKFMLNYSRWQNTLPPKSFSAGYWPRMRFGDNLETVYWLYNRTGEPWLLDLAKKIHENMADWTGGVPDRLWHNVNFAECFREPAEYGMQARQPKFLAATERNYEMMMGLYGQFPGGGFAGDEICRKGHGDPRQGFETCAMVEFIHSFQMLERISGNPLWADRCEQIAFNSLPAALTPDLKALHYLTGANMVQLDRKNKAPGINNKGTMLSYSPYKAYRCCQHNHGMGWPYYAEELWLRTADGGLMASLYAASEVTAKVGKSGDEVRIVQETDYPFGDTIAMKISAAKPVSFSLYLRLPAWVKKATLQVNGRDMAVDAKPLAYVAIDRTWQDGDRLTLQLPMQVDVKKWTKNKDSVSIAYGPLEFSLKIGERWVRYGGSDAWPEWEVYPTTPWNYGLALDPPNFEVVRKPGALAAQPFTPETAPIEIRLKARRVPAWSADKNGLAEVLPQSPVKSDEPEATVTLIPMGAARLRISAFPTVAPTTPPPAKKP
ncbi:MAG: beta-L-arabinofuranosidase domain-containing protein [Thermoguttaceae bacterium]